MSQVVEFNSSVERAAGGSPQAARETERTGEITWGIRFLRIVRPRQLPRTHSTAQNAESLLQFSHIAQVPEVAVVVQSVANDEDVGGIESDVGDLHVMLSSGWLVQQGAHVHGGRA